MVKKITRNVSVAICILAASIFSCTKEKPGAPYIPPPNYLIKTGTGDFIYEDYKPLADRPVKVFYYNPGQNTAKVLILMHGNSRAAQSYFNSMKKYAEQYKFLLIVPEFTAELYNSRLYHRGGVLDAQGKIRSHENWTFSMIEPLFDYVKKNSGNTSEDYILYGFSAGAQFVHRLMTFVPDNRVACLVSGAAGTYTMPDYNINYHYGVKDVASIVPQTNLNKFYAKNTFIVVGSNDNDPNDADLTTTPEANAQGQHRVERAKTYFDRSKAVATQQAVPFNWKHQVIPGVGHSQGSMAGPVAKLLFDNKVL